MIRTTGRRSQNHLLHGNCQDIADQLGMPKEAVYRLMLVEAAEESIIGAQTYWLFGHSHVVFTHESEWTTKQAADVLELIQRKVALLAAQYKKPFYLTVYDQDGNPVKEWTKP